MKRRFLLVVEYRQLEYGFAINKTEEFLLSGDEIEIVPGGGIVVIRKTAKQTRRQTFAESMVKDLRELQSF